MFIYTWFNADMLLDLETNHVCLEPGVNNYYGDGKLSTTEIFSTNALGEWVCIHGLCHFLFFIF